MQVFKKMLSKTCIIIYNVCNIQFYFKDNICRDIIKELLVVSRIAPIGTQFCRN